MHHPTLVGRMYLVGNRSQSALNGQSCVYNVRLTDDTPSQMTVEPVILPTPVHAEHERIFELDTATSLCVFARVDTDRWSLFCMSTPALSTEGY
jgi:hypothetical protein